MDKAWKASMWLMAAMLGMAVGAHAQTAAHGPGTWGTPWSYAGPIGPQHWGDLDPQYAACKNGREQSPIDIGETTPAQLPALRFTFKPGPLRIINNGYTAVRVNYPPGNGNVLSVGDRRYELTQFHFHHPSEEYLHGRPYAMGIHLMYASSDGKIAAVAVLLRAGAANAVVEQLWKYMPTSAGKEREIAGVEVNPAGLLPRDTGYSMYTGSLTAPPCSEGVTWMVLKTPVEVSAGEIQTFAKLYPHDVRPPQPLHGRIVKSSR